MDDLVVLNDLISRDLEDASEARSSEREKRRFQQNNNAQIYTKNAAEKSA
jgi:hypothetical protein